MRVANLSGRAVIVEGDRALDIERASGNRFTSDLDDLFDRWEEFRSWAAHSSDEEWTVFDPQLLGPPVHSRPQVFGIGLNYRDHAEEAGLELPDDPMVFTKFPSSVTGPGAHVVLPSDGVDFEVELVVVIGRGGRDIPAADAWDHVAGVTVGQDLSERSVQFRGAPPQFSLGKSYPGFAPVGPVLVTPDELPNREDLRIGCSSGGEVLQDGRTSDMVFPVAELIARLSAIVELLAGDLIFTGTPAGVGAVRTPPRFLTAQDELVSVIEGIGELRTTFQ